jgi:hypothetical protein
VEDMSILGTAAIVEDMSILATSDIVTDMSILGTADVVSDMNTLGTADNVTNMNTVADNISNVNNFAARYRIASSAPGSSLDAGDLYFDTTANALYHYNGSAWAAVQSYTAGTGITLSGGAFSASPVALTTIQTAANQVAHLALTAQEGDVVVRSDESKTYMHNGGSAGSMSDYTLMATPTDSVTSVVGQTGVVTTAQIKTALEDGIDSVHYKDGSIDNVHLADDAVDSDELAAGAVDNAHLADDAVDSDELAAGAVDIAHLSASGSAGSTTFLRGDNSWVTPTDTDTVYTHPTSAGNVHIPSGGAAGQILKYASAGTAAWGSDDAVAMAIALG